MSGLSASTYSCGGEGARFGGGGEAALAGVLGLKYFSKPMLRWTDAAMVSSSVDGGDDREDESEPDMVLAYRGRWFGRRRYGVVDACPVDGGG